MNTTRTQIRWLVGIVLAHLAVSLVHGAAHTGAHVPLGPAAHLFVVTVILTGPLVGIAAIRMARRVAALLVAATMTGALLFGILSHFVLGSPDHVAQVDVEWRPLFAVTAGLLAVTEALGAGLAIRLSRQEPLS